ncbi:MAG TPA: molybdenum cofactor biosynthesis protein MoaE [Candidatus Azoamicus sp. OHIO2]
MTYNIKITTEQIDLASIPCFLNQNTGATVIFLGTIRKINKSKKVQQVLYVIFNDLFKSIFKKKCLQLLHEKKNIRIYIIQASGLLIVGNINSLIAVAAVNRQDAFYICRDLVETLKYNAPVWKKEFYLDGSFSWLNV